MELNQNDDLRAIRHDSRLETSDHSYSKTKSAFSSIWNNLKYEFQNKFRSNFNLESPICFLGQFYLIESVECGERKNVNLYAYERFKQDFYSRIWFTYRKEFPSLLDSNITSDSGWGCMIRTGQMILAQALLVHFLGRNWRWNGEISANDDTTHRMIVKWFGDNPDPSISPFSIHELVRIGQTIGKKPGDWFGPSSISLIIKNAVENNPFLNSNICCYVAQDSTIYIQDVIDLSTKNNPEHTNEESKKWRSIIIFIPVRLGGERFNSVYSAYFKELLSLPTCLGIIGGKPRHSLYFVGYQEDKLVCMDPHYCQGIVDVTQPNFLLDTFHCRGPRKVSLHSIDPSCTIGFYVRSKNKFNDFCNSIKQLSATTDQAIDYPIFVLNEGSFEQCVHDSNDDTRDRILKMKYQLVDSNGQVKKVINTEEFVML